MFRLTMFSLVIQSVFAFATGCDGGDKEESEAKQATSEEPKSAQEHGVKGALDFVLAGENPVPEYKKAAEAITGRATESSEIGAASKDSNSGKNGSSTASDIVEFLPSSLSSIELDISVNSIKELRPFATPSGQGSSFAELISEGPEFESFRRFFGLSDKDVKLFVVIYGFSSLTLARVDIYHWSQKRRFNCRADLFSNLGLPKFAKKMPIMGTHISNCVRNGNERYDAYGEHEWMNGTAKAVLNISRSSQSYVSNLAKSKGVKVDDSYTTQWSISRRTLPEERYREILSTTKRDVEFVGNAWFRVRKEESACNVERGNSEGGKIDASLIDIGLEYYDGIGKYKSAEKKCGGLSGCQYVECFNRVFR